MIVSGDLHMAVGPTRLAREAMWIASIGIGFIDFFLELYAPETVVRAPWNRHGKIALDDKDEHDEQESPVLTANIYERLCFSWLTPLLSLGTKKFLGEEDMWSLPPNDSAEALSNRLADAWDHQVKTKKKPSLKMAIFKAYGWPYLIAGMLKAVYDSFSFLQPQLLRLLLSFVSSYGTDNPMSAAAGYVITILMFVSANLATATLHQYFDRCFATSE